MVKKQQNEEEARWWVILLVIIILLGFIFVMFVMVDKYADHLEDKENKIEERYNRICSENNLSVGEFYMGEGKVCIEFDGKKIVDKYKIKLINQEGDYILEKSRFGI